MRKTSAHSGSIIKTVFLLFSIVVSLNSCNGNPGEERTDSAPENPELNEVPESLLPEAEPLAINLEEATVNNQNFREVIWTGDHMQLVLLSLEPGEEIAMEMHEDLNQLLKIEKGQAQILIGPSRDELNFEREVQEDWAVLIPANHYHSVKNTGEGPLKLYTLFAPGAYPQNEVVETLEETEEP